MILCGRKNISMNRENSRMIRKGGEPNGEIMMDVRKKEVGGKETDVDDTQIEVLTS